MIYVFRYDHGTKTFPVTDRLLAEDALSGRWRTLAVAVLLCYILAMSEGLQPDANSIPSNKDRAICESGYKENQDVGKILVDFSRVTHYC
jgi:hypothetical protein